MKKRITFSGRGSGKMRALERMAQQMADDLRVAQINSGEAELPGWFRTLDIGTLKNSVVDKVVSGLLRDINK